MLCPEVSVFPPPKVISSCKRTENIEHVVENINMNNFYKSIIVTCPDEVVIPSFIDEIISEDSEYYKISDCPLTEFVEPVFVQNFVKSGKLYCVSVNRNCVVENCAAITPEGIFTLHILEFVFQTIGLEGIKRPLGFYEIKIDLNNIKKVEKIRECLRKLENFDFYISWEPGEDNICPSSIAKYFWDRNVNVTVQTLQIKKITPSITNIPSLKDVEPDEMTEWLGMLAHEGELDPKETYISNYMEPTSDYTLESSRISLLIAKGFMTPIIIGKVCKSLLQYVSSREMENYWACLSVQSQEDSLWQWSRSSPRMFQAHDSSCNIFLTHREHIMYLIGQIKYS